MSNASNLVAGSNDSNYDIFLRDIETGTTTLESRNSAGVQGADFSSLQRGCLSADGTRIVFESYSDDLTEESTTNLQVYLRDIPSGTTTLISKNESGIPGDSYSGVPVISGDGRHIAFHGESLNLVPGITNRTFDVFVLSEPSPKSSAAVPDNSVIRAFLLNKIKKLKKKAKKAKKKGKKAKAKKLKKKAKKLTKRLRAL